MRRHPRPNDLVRPADERPARSAAERPWGTRHDGQQRVGGYRLVRVLGEGRSAVVHLGHADTAADDEPRRAAAVKVYRPGIPAERIDVEVAALAAVSHPHVLRLIDIATAPDGRPCLVVERCAAGTLAGLVANRSSLAAGEAVTILAPLVAAVEALHAAGFVHRDIRLPRVLFRQSGAPVLAGLGHATRIEAALPPAALAAHPEVLDDRVQLARLVGAVLERVEHPGARGIESWLERAPQSADDFTARLSDALFDLAEAQPVRMRDDGSPPVTAAQPRRPAAAVDAPGGVTVTTRLVAAARALAVRTRGVRRGVWVAAAGMAVSLLVAALAIPTGDTRAEPGGQQSERVESADTGASAAPPDGAVPGDDARGSDDARGNDEARGDDARGDDGVAPVGEVVLGDDPVAAIVVLLDERDRCLREISVLCLDGVAQAGSAAMERDAAVVRALQAGGEQTSDAAISAEGPVLVERLGDSALLDLGDVPETQPASALVMRGEAGWRIRDYFDE
ncbi:hypothetical protein GCM10027413_17190 [Conyzicola nivalis]|uniref:Protein kinase domain-containing protein n=1 Tax=Conyzicola nivalis TaxID=1477021 RepID=A0A916SFR8_9MICO|nr:protein kinase [Conyzicola nivalis]GGA97088.1 hypothetical protein GCM10010979_09430 [Conyzicola nivalis]